MAKVAGIARQVIAPAFAFGVKDPETAALFGRIERVPQERRCGRDFQAAPVTPVAVEIVQRHRMDDRGQRISGLFISSALIAADFWAVRSSIRRAGILIAGLASSS